ncbi:MAG: elongation factor P [Sandaracinaceae bacterium]|nr:elongation factor P [Sandaracinaceae bacterium]MDW8246421.1 elongation factor P [Sandaracinaceae bacterium]
MYSITDLRKNLKIIIDGEPYVILESQFVKPGKGQAFTRTKVRNLLTGAVIERTFKHNETIPKADVEERQCTYSYKEGKNHIFMDAQTYDQIPLSPEQLGDAVNYLQEGMTVNILFWNGRPIGVTPPTFVELKVTQTEPGFRGDTATNTLKPAKVETGATVMVPLFVNEGDVIKIDTRTGEYVERVRTR